MLGPAPAPRHPSDEAAPGAIPPVPGATRVQSRPNIDELATVRLTTPYTRDTPGEMPLIHIMQRRLNLPPEEIDGIFGPVTREHLRDWQAQWNADHPDDQIAVDGIAGRQVWSRLVFPETATRAPAQEPEVAPVRAEATLAPDQTPEGLPVPRPGHEVRSDPAQPTDTIRPLDAPRAGQLHPPEISVGDNDNRRPGDIAWVSELQRRLGIGVDGVFGAGETRPAVVRFQTNYNAEYADSTGFVPLRTDGVVDETTWDAVFATRPAQTRELDQTPIDGDLPSPYTGDTSLELALPPRPDGAPGGQAFLDALATSENPEQAIIDAFLSGNVPDHMRQLVPFSVTRHGMEVEFYTLPDVIAIGSNDDYVAIPMWRQSAEVIAERTGTALPTPQMVYDRYEHADYRFVPHPLGGSATAESRF
ncbi:MAG: peptidoglycan-binding domain-containing protein, partial [Myxococcota bacterium]